MRKIFLILFCSIFLSSILYAAQSTITEADGSACMGEDRSKKQTENLAFEDAKRKAVEWTLTYLKSETVVNKYELQKDLIEAYSNAAIKIIQEMEKKWYKDESLGDCFKVKIKAEVIPDEKAIENISKNNQMSDDPSAPLSIKVWADKKEYKGSDKIRVYIKGNKPFYARVVYKDAGGNMVQLLPNPHRGSNYFNGGTIYELPSGEDKFELEVTPPFGEEDIIVYASTSPLGDIELQAEGGIYQVKTKAGDIGDRTRGIKIKEKTGSKEGMPSDFFEDKVVVRTER
ncbi:MAG: hypothetical protein A2889_04030 [Nitrospinae bacterium RIFCSPLOWO2_01_FULL_39_10]|nr:MAG: hypothetical protein A2889_04030 [Nitrospinae bacterium RIFCSPLOWO2_01_FULL_39_10]